MQDDNKVVDRAVNEPEESSAGPVIGTIIILAVIILGGLYFWGERANNQELDEFISEEETQAQVEEIQTQSTSDDPSAIEADLESTDIEGLDAELDVE